MTKCHYTLFDIFFDHYQFFQNFSICVIGKAYYTLKNAIFDIKNSIFMGF